MLLFIITDVADDDMEDGSETASDASEIYHLPHQLWTEIWSFESAELISKYYACKHSVQFISDKIKIPYFPFAALPLRSLLRDLEVKIGLYFGLFLQ